MATKKTASAKKTAGAKPSAGGGSAITIFSYGAPADEVGGADEYADQQETMSFPFLGRLIERRAEISPEKLKKNLASFLDSMGSAMAGVPDFLAGYKLEEIELSLEIGAEGEIGLLGTGGKLSGKGSITLKLKKP